ncbi:MAG: hypothetical protein IT323_11935 [Anaerolineae bacterium]|nr:hypothetical protein [Anaerolineae bacterium]
MTTIDHREVEEGQVQTPSPDAASVPPAGARRPIIRLAVLGLILIVACVALVVLAFQLMRSSRSGPIEVEVYPGAQIVQQGQTPNSDDRTFQTASSVREVYEFYAARLGAEDSRGCRLMQDEQTGLDAAKCVVDNSQDEIVHDMLITIDAIEGGASIRIERRWGGN